MPFNKKAPADLQAVWHEYVGALFFKKTILDVGAGRGKSKERMSVNENVVTTLDVNRNLMTTVDVIEDPWRLEGEWDVVTAFDVIEHVSHPTEFIYSCLARCKDVVILTTPNKHAVDHPWHFYPEEFEVLAGDSPQLSDYFLREKTECSDAIHPVSRGEFLTASRKFIGLGIMVRKSQ